MVIAATSEQQHEVVRFEKDSSTIVRDAIEAALEGVQERAAARFTGRKVEFAHRWHFSDDAVVLQSVITGVTVESSENNETIYLRWNVRVRDPRNGHTVTLDLNPGLCRFLE